MSAAYIFEPSEFAGYESAASAISSALEGGRIPESTIAAMFKDGWEQSLQFPQTHMPQLYLRAVVAFARASVSALAGECNSKPTASYRLMVENGTVEDYNERVMQGGLYDRLLDLVGRRKWSELQDYSGPITWGKVQIDLTPAQAIHKYVALPLIYGEWPSDEAWEQVSFGREKSPFESPDSVTGLVMLNRASLSGDCIKRAEGFAFERYSSELRSDEITLPMASSGEPSVPPNTMLASASKKIEEAIAKVTPKMTKGDPKKLNWLPWVFGTALVGAGAYYVLRRDND